MEWICSCECIFEHDHYSMVIFTCKSQYGARLRQYYAIIKNMTGNTVFLTANGYGALKQVKLYYLDNNKIIILARRTKMGEEQYLVQ